MESKKLVSADGKMSASEVSLLLRIRTRQGKTPGNADQSTVAV
jgi:hypothetical protein